MYAKGMTTRQISETIEDIYGFETSESFISDVTDKILPQIEDWQNRPLDDVYPILYIDAIHYSVRDNGVIRKLAAYVILGINTEGKKEVLTITVGEGHLYNKCDRITELHIPVHFTELSGRHSVLERPFSEANGRPFLVKRSPLIVC